eukprot:scaffold24719_cov147-Cylindrotheca_fusiformis.AAC.2
MPDSSCCTFVYDSPKCRLPTDATQVTISNMEEIPARAFRHKFVQELRDLDIEEGVQVIGEEAFSMGWALGNVRLPATISEIQKDAFSHCVLQLRSVELSPNPTAIGNSAFQGCARLRNIAIAKSDEKKLGKRIFKGCHNLSKVIADPEKLLKALVHRFDEFPVHKVCYYQSYDSCEETLEKLQACFEQQRRPTYVSQDCLGMTPLHILTLSKTQRLDLYKACVQFNPKDLVTEDKWGALPVHYACENNAPVEIVQYLLGEQESYFKEEMVNWNDFFLKNGPEFFGNANMDLVKLLLDYQRRNCPNTLDWKQLIHDVNCFGSIDIFRFVVRASLEDRVNAMEHGPWREEVAKEINEIPEESLYTAAWAQTEEVPESSTGIDHVDMIQEKLAKYESLNQTFLMEIVFWKLKMKSEGNDDNADEAFRNYCRISTGAEHIIPNVLSFLP